MGRPADRAGRLGENAIHRLGENMSVRIPRRYEGKREQVAKEHRWLPRLAPHLPLEIPFPLAMGMPGEGYAGPWSVYRWLEGVNATRERIADLGEAATALARFVNAMQGIDPTGGPTPGHHNFFRGVPLAQRDSYTRAAIAASRGLVDDATWARGRGTALSVALVGLSSYLDTNPTVVASSRHTIAEVLADHAHGA